VAPVSSVRCVENYEVLKHEDGTPIELVCRLTYNDDVAAGQLAVFQGATGVTYKALDVDLRCPVTLKVISARYLGDESARLSFLREARAAASLRHPNVGAAQSPRR
jgi:hypothetical protein